ncbi:iron-siderophore ABC transporter substrate-binding protein [Vibrio sp. T187]|uniref:ABC transporter substrate-binding protein n=1 Tax=Vibrio TaxID=662 RepID=UPI0010C9BDB4|nr:MULTISPECIES: iron-siderophore ABC transporter substrate-binding protein [Vibrio]MBW3698114.1 iron-siderophore ABC transporter substrate-binding protein [Vibrio sp. T187]
MKHVLIILAALATWSVQAIEIKHELGVTTFKQTPVKVVALDWALTETILSLDVVPVGVADVKGYNTWVEYPVLPKESIDVGSRREPNLELLTKLDPDVILISKHMSAAYEQLNKIAPTIAFSVYSEKKTPIESATHITRELGSLLGKDLQAEQVISATQAKFKANGDKVTKANPDSKPLMFVRFIDDKTLRIHSDGSLAQATIQSMGLSNSWTEPTNLWGFTTAGIEKVAEHQKTNMMIFGPLNKQERAQLTQSALWQAMEFSRSKSVYELPPIWTFGGLIAAQRFSDQITEELTK